MINEGDKKSFLSSFLIDLDLAVKVDRIQASGAKGITGTRAFMAIGVLMGEGHTFMDDLESFFCYSGYAFITTGQMEANP